MERFRRVLQGAKGWLDIDELVAVCDQADYWSQEFREHAARAAKKAHVRRLIRALRDDGRWPQWASVEITTPEGRTTRVYKQELLFDLEDYRKVIHYHAGLGRHHFEMARGYAARAEQRFSVQLSLFE